MKLAKILVAMGAFIGLCVGAWWLCPNDTEPVGLQAAESSPGQPRPIVLYDFRKTDADIVKDHSGVGTPLNLAIKDRGAIRTLPGAVEIRGKANIESLGPARKIIDAVKRSGEITVEAWLEPADNRQDGPARIVTISKNPNERNFTLGQERNQYDVRLRTTRTSSNGIPSTATNRGTVETKLTHIVYSRNRLGQVRIFLNGKLSEEKNVGGSLSNWDPNFRLSLANELSGDRPWRGKIYRVAIYDVALTGQHVTLNHRAGPQSEDLEKLIAEAKAAEQSHVFATKVAPILANHCLECHDSLTKEGGLDLSRKAPAMKGGDNGVPIVSGQHAKSLLWTRVESNEMPENRPPLSDMEKQVLKQWLDDGATWSVEFLDPAVYAHNQQAGGIILQRHTREEYIATVKAATGVDIAKDAMKLLPKDLRADGFRNTAYNLNVDLKHVEAYAQLAERIVSRMDPVAFAGRFERGRTLTDKNMRDLIAKMGKWILRGPLNEDEIVTYRGISTTVAHSGGDFREAVAFILEAMLQSPRFLYRIERHHQSGMKSPVGPYELASRMSYILWGAPPDEALLKDADAGRLSNADVVQAHVTRMLKDPRAVERSLQFATEWLNLGRLENLNPNPNKYPNWDPKLAEDMKRETLEFFEEIVWTQNRSLADLLNAKVTFLSPGLAKHYGLPAKNNAWAKYDLSDHPERGGLLTQGSVLTVGGDEASMVTRGLFVLHDVLRGVVKDPPPCVDTTPVPTKAGLTQRGVAEARIQNANCGGCHSRFEPLAFGLEKFDGLGGFQNEDRHGNTLREDGKILFPGGTQIHNYKTSAELMELLAKSDRVQQTMTWKLIQFSLGRPLSAVDAPIVEKVRQATQKAGGTYSTFMSALIQSDLVQTIRSESRD